MKTTSQPIARPGENCWKTAASKRVACLIDAAPYFDVLCRVMERAQNTIYIIGWDIDSRVRLHRDIDEHQCESPVQLGPFVNELARRTPGLHIYILIWDYSIIYAPVREFLAELKLDWKTNRRVKLRFDDTCPPEASHHQKIVVVDDAIAFCGGIDLTSHRWDRPEHPVSDQERKNTLGMSYGPYHDMQLMVDGDAARVLGDLARTRWHRATGKKIMRPPLRSGDIWPEDLGPDFRDVDVIIARTDPLNREGNIEEVKRLYVDTIENAKDYIYVENQYLTSKVIKEALIDSLSKPVGPEIVIVIPKEGNTFIEQGTIYALRNRVIKELMQSDVHDRMRTYYPVADVRQGVDVFVHAKVCISDDRLFRIGSSNLSNRSMGLDTECDLAVESLDSERVKKSIRKLRNRFIAHHFGISEDEVNRVDETKKSCIQLIETFTGHDRTLQPVETDTPEWMTESMPESAFFDPEEPLIPRQYHFENVHDPEPVGMRRKLILFLGLVFFFGVLAILWRFTPLKEMITPEKLQSYVLPIQSTLWGPLAAIGTYLVGGVLMVPVTLLILVTALVFDPVMAFIVAMIGSVGSAMMGYGMGEVFGSDVIQKLAGKRIKKVSKRIAKRGIAASAVIRIIPVAPFSIINMIAGISHVRFRDYLIGTVIGMAPGIFAITVLGDRLVSMIRDPSPANVMLFIGVAVFVGVVLVTIKRFLPQQKKESASSTHRQEEQE